MSLTGCSKLEFPPEITAAPDTSDASSSSGLAVHVKVPQTAAFNANGLAESALRDTTVALPAGVAINPSGGDGLQSCSSNAGALPLDALGEPAALGTSGDQIGYLGEAQLNPDEPGVKWDTFTSELPSPLQQGSNFCPDGSKIASVKLKTPLLPEPAEGLRLPRHPEREPVRVSLVAMYIVAEDPVSGNARQAPGEVQLCRRRPGSRVPCRPQPDHQDLREHAASSPSKTPNCTSSAANARPWRPPRAAGPTRHRRRSRRGPANRPVTVDLLDVRDTSGPNGSACPGAACRSARSLRAGRRTSTRARSAR